MDGRRWRTLSNDKSSHGLWPGELIMLPMLKLDTSYDFQELFLNFTINKWYFHDDFSSLFHSECKLILYLTTMYVYCVYHAISKSPKHLPNCLKITETSFVLIVFNGGSAYTVTVSFCRSTWIRYQKCFIRPMT
jgi:RNase P/RNase MRP subunit p30